MLANIENPSSGAQCGSLWLLYVLSLFLLTGCEWAPRPNDPAPESGLAAKAASATTSAGDPAPSIPPGTRPAHSTGRGFYVDRGRLYDSKGHEFTIRGVNRNHYDSDSAVGIAQSGANSVRIFVTTQYGKTWQDLANIVQKDHLSNREVPIPTFTSSSGGKGTSCNEDPSTLDGVVSDWLSSSPSWLPLTRYSIINVANEWGPGDSPVWRDSYIKAVLRMREGGYRDTIMIDTGSCGQDTADLLKYAAVVLDADPQRNLIFSFHVYGGLPSQWTLESLDLFFGKLQTLSQTQGTAFVIGEFGPGRNIGPSPTMLTPAQVIGAAETHGIGWLAWAWDDNDQGGCRSSDDGFSMTKKCGEYNDASDLTTFGKQIVLDPKTGLKALARRATVF